MKRDDVLATLRKLSPALHTKELIEVLACFCFSKDGVVAWDDTNAIYAPKKFGFAGAVRGKPLLDMVSIMQGDDVEFSVNDTELLVKCGNSRYKSPLLPADDFLFELPEMSSNALPSSATLIKAINVATIAMGEDISMPWCMGVTVVADGGRMRLYASDNRTAVRVTIKSDAKVVAILPPQFCRLLGQIANDDQITGLFVDDDWVEAAFSSGVRLFSRGLATVDAKKYTELFSVFESANDMVDIPEELSPALDRAMTVIPYSREPYTRMVVKDETLGLSTAAPVANVRDFVELTDHENIDVCVIPELMRRALPHVASIKFCNDFVLMRGRGFEYVVSTVSKIES